MQVELDDAFVNQMRSLARRQIKGMSSEELLKVIYQADDLEGLRARALEMLDTLPVERVIKLALSGTPADTGGKQGAQPYTGKRRGRRPKSETAAE